MKIVLKPLDAVIPYARNPRYNSGAVAKVAASIKEFGFRQPIVVDEDGVILVGHTRLEAAQQLAMAEVPVHIATGLSDAQKKAYRIMDNRSHEDSRWDEDLLPLELEDLAAAGYDLALTGFENAEIERLRHDSPDTLKDEAAPERPETPVSEVGDLWMLGKHRVVCGDSTDPGVVTSVLDGALPSLMVTDPPYGVEYDPSWRNDAAAKGQISFAARREGKVPNDDKADWSAAWAHFQGNVAYVWHSALMTMPVIESLRDFDIRAIVIWAKPNHSISRGHYHWQHEPCIYAVRHGKTAHWIGDRSQSTIWNIAKQYDDTDKTHGTQKPLECMARPIHNHEGDVYDPFLGTGTTLIAAEHYGRVAYGCELDPGYCDVIVERWENLTGGKAKRGTRTQTKADKSQIDTGQSRQAPPKRKRSPDQSIATGAA